MRRPAATKSRRALIVLVVLALTIALALATTAGAKQYVLPRPKHEHCRTHYARKVEKVKRRHAEELASQAEGR